MVSLMHHLLTPAFCHPVHTCGHTDGLYNLYPELWSGSMGPSFCCIGEIELLFLLVPLSYFTSVNYLYNWLSFSFLSLIAYNLFSFSFLSCSLLPSSHSPLLLNTFLFLFSAVYLCYFCLKAKKIISDKLNSRWYISKRKERPMCVFLQQVNICWTPTVC